MRGYQVLYTGATEMLQRPRAAHADRSRDRLPAKLLDVDLLIIDDLGLRPLTHDKPVDLYDVIRTWIDHHHRESSHRRIGTALLRPTASERSARLLHHARVIELTGQSYCARKKGANVESDADPSDKSTVKGDQMSRSAE
jgi:DNA replication protein DnaC